MLGRVVIDRLTRHRRAVLPEMRQPVIDFEPRKLILRPDMIVRSHALRLIEASNGNLYAVAEDFFVHGQGTATDRAEAVLGVSRRPVAHGLAFDPGK